MSEPIIMKTCRVCKETKPFSEFYKSSHYHDGHNSKCKICYLKHCKEYSQTEQGKAIKSEYQKRYRQTKKGKSAQKRYNQSEKGKSAIKRYYQSKKGKVAWRKSKFNYLFHHPERSQAKSAVNNAIREGKLPRPDTLQCHYGEHPAEQYHHHLGYEPEHWLDVVPACRKCHKKSHLKTAI